MQHDFDHDPGTAARHYAERWHLAVVPVCWPDDRGRCGCGWGHPLKNAGKAPLFAGYNQRMLKPAEVARWWRRYPQANVGLQLRFSHLIVVDPDSPEALREAEELGLPSTWTVETGRGYHFYYRNRSPYHARRTKQGTGRAIDVLARGIVVAPPSRHRSGRVYRWVPGFSPEEITLADAPAWVVEILRARHRGARGDTGMDARPGSGVPLAWVRRLALPRRLKQLLLYGPEGTSFPSRSEALWAIERAAIRAGMEDEAIVAMLLKVPWIAQMRPNMAAWLFSDLKRAREKGARPSAAWRQAQELDVSPRHLRRLRRWGVSL